jgi:uncharacterized membrane protein
MNDESSQARNSAAAAISRGSPKRPIGVEAITWSRIGPVIGAVIGTFGGYQLRTRLVRGLKVKDIFIAIPEDLVAIGLGYLLVSAR